MKARVGTFATNKFTNAIQHSTIALTWIRSGVGEPPKINVIPSVAEAGLDCRVLPGTTKDQWIDEIKRRLGDPALKIELVNESDDPVVTPHDTPLYRNIEAAIKRRHPDAVVTPMLIPYGTDSNAFRPKGVSSYGSSPRSSPPTPCRRCTATPNGRRSMASAKPPRCSSTRSADARKVERPRDSGSVFSLRLSKYQRGLTSRKGNVKRL
jgi:hypothetical protein